MHWPGYRLLVSIGQSAAADEGSHFQHTPSQSCSRSICMPNIRWCSRGALWLDCSVRLETISVRRRNALSPHLYPAKRTGWQCRTNPVRSVFFGWLFGIFSNKICLPKWIGRNKNPPIAQLVFRPILPFLGRLRYSWWWNQILGWWFWFEMVAICGQAKSALLWQKKRARVNGFAWLLGSLLNLLI